MGIYQIWSNHHHRDNDNREYSTYKKHESTNNELGFVRIPVPTEDSYSFVANAMPKYNIIMSGEFPFDF